MEVCISVGIKDFYERLFLTDSKKANSFHHFFSKTSVIFSRLFEKIQNFFFPTLLGKVLEFF